MKYIGADELENKANDLSSFYGNGGPYTGYGDDMLDFGGPQGSFADPIQRGKIYNLTIINASTTLTSTALLCPGLIYNAQGLIADGSFTSQEGNSGLSAQGQPEPIAYFNAFMKYFPTLVAAFKVTTSNLNQMEQNVTIVKQSPFKQHESRIINVAIYANEINPNQNLITVPESFYMDMQTQIGYAVLPSTTVTLGMIFGTSLSLAKALRSKTERAASTLAVQGKTTAYNNFRGR